MWRSRFRWKRLLNLRSFIRYSVAVSTEVGRFVCVEISEMLSVALGLWTRNDFRLLRHIRRGVRVDRFSEPLSKRVRGNVFLATGNSPTGELFPDRRSETAVKNNKIACFVILQNIGFFFNLAIRHFSFQTRFTPYVATLWIYPDYAGPKLFFSIGLRRASYFPSRTPLSRDQIAFSPGLTPKSFDRVHSWPCTCPHEISHLLFRKRDTHLSGGWTYEE